jgi:hypothetical protein
MLFGFFVDFLEKKPCLHSFKTFFWIVFLRFLNLASHQCFQVQDTNGRLDPLCSTDGLRLGCSGDRSTLIRSGRKKRRRILLYPLDHRFCRCSKRNKKTEQKTAGIPDALVPPQTSLATDSTSVQ